MFLKRKRDRIERVQNSKLDEIKNNVKKFCKSINVDQFDENIFSNVKPNASYAYLNLTPET